MKTIPLKYLIIISLLCVIIGVSAQAAPPENGQTTLRSASELDYPPFAVVLPDGRASGFSVDLLQVICTTLERKVTFKVAAWSKIKQELADGDLDLLPLVSYSKERDLIYDFTAPYLQMHGTIFVRKENNSIKSLADLHDKEILVMRGDTAHEYTLKENISNKLILTDTFEEALKMLAAGRHDAVVIQEIVGLQIIKKYNLNNLRPVLSHQVDTLKPTSLRLKGFEQKFCIAVHEGDIQLLAELNEGLAIVFTDGTYQALYSKWFTPILPQPTLSLADLFKYLLWVGVPILLLLALGGLWFTKREVANKTRSLRNEIEERKRVEKQLKNNEQRFRFIVDSLEKTGLGLLIVDRDYRIRFMNQILIDEYGERTGDFCYQAMARRESPCSYCQLLSVIDDKEVIQYQPITTNGKTYDSIAGPITNSDGTVSKMVITRDISVQKEEERLKIEKSRQKEQLQRLESLKNMAGAIAHRFNNSMTAVICNLELMELTMADDADEKNMLSQSLQASLEASKIGSMMLTYIGQRPQQFSTASLSALARETLTEELKGHFPKSISLSFAPTSTPLLCSIDQTQIKEVFINILTNAIESLENRVGTIEISFGQESYESNSFPLPFQGENIEKGLYSFCQIKDCGHGINAEDLPRIFEPFFTTRFVGRGLGLALTVGIMRAHHGALIVSSEPDTGTTVRMLLPAL